MKRIFIILAILAVAFSNASCEKGTPGGEGNESVIDKPGSETDKPDSETDKPGSETDKPGSETDKPDSETDNPGSEDEEPIEVPQNYELIEIENFNSCYAGNYGVYYVSQPSDVDNWLLELAVPTYNLVDYSGTGYNFAADIFTLSSNGINLQEGTYTISAFEKSSYCNLSMHPAYADEEITMGTWLWDGDDAVLGATDGKLIIKKSTDNQYEISIEIIDEDWEVALIATYKGEIEIYDNRNPDSEPVSGISLPTKSSSRKPAGTISKLYGNRRK